MSQAGLPKLIIISAPSGTGKSTVASILLETGRNLVRSISYTTRPPREGEVHGRDYFFVSQEEFLRGVSRGDFLEYAEIYGNYYGTSQQQIRKQLGLGNSVLLIIDVQGAGLLRNNTSIQIPILSIFLLPPSFQALKERIEKRATDSKVEIEKRLKNFDYELSFADDYDFKVVNQDVSATVQEIQKILY